MDKLVKIGMVIGAVSVAYEVGKYHEIGIVRSLFNKLNEEGYVKYFDKEGNECTLAEMCKIAASE